MLCQLVCTDRRYQRMNCFNIRELQSILKRKFFTDLFNSHDHRELLGKSMIGLRYTLNNSANLNHDLLSFYQFGIYTEAGTKATSLVNFYHAGINNFTAITFVSGYLAPLFELNFITRLTYLLPNLFYTYKLFLFECFQFMFATKGLDIFYHMYLYLSMNLSTNVFYLFSGLSNPFFFNTKYLLTSSVPFTTNIESTSTLDSTPNVVNYQTSASTPTFSAGNLMYQYSEHSLIGSGRITRYSLPLVSYDYKCGNYLGI